jgi:N-acetylmuramoyl-L-alanine amidase
MTNKNIIALFFALLTAVFLAYMFTISIKGRYDKEHSADEIEFAFEDTEEDLDSSMIAEYTTGYDQVYLIIHTSAESDKGQFRDGDHINKFFTDAVPAGRGWINPGYHEWLSRDCKWYQLKDFNIDCFMEPWERSNGARGYNSISIHLSYSSAIPAKNPTADTRTKCQKEMLEDRVRLYKSICPNIIVQGHRDLKGVTKSCPNFNAIEEYKHIH